MNDARIAEALFAAVPAGTGDWADVAARAAVLRKTRRRRRKLTLALAFALVLITAGTALAVGNRFFDWFSVEASRQEAPTLPAGAPYVAGATFYGAGAEPQSLSRSLVAPLLGQDATLAVLSPDERYLAYHSALMNPPNDLTVVPLLYVHDTVTGRDRLISRGAQTVAWDRDGRIAYFRATRDQYNGRHGAYVGHVVVGTLTRPATAWTRIAGVYEVLAWARGRLLVGVAGCYFPNCRRDPPRGVYVLEESGRLRPLPLATLAALSPDGRYAFGRFDLSAGQDSASPFVRVLEIARGKPVATLDLTQAMRRSGLRGLLPGALSAGGAWRGDEIVVTFRGRDSALVFLRMVGRRLTLDSVARIPSQPFRVRTRYGVSFGGSPFFAKGSNVIVPIRGETLRGRYLVSIASCSRRTRRCVRGTILPPRRWFAVADNPSRPKPNRR
jgi:hypothetical protein